MEVLERKLGGFLELWRLQFAVGEKLSSQVCMKLKFYPCLDLRWLGVGSKLINEKAL